MPTTVLFLSSLWLEKRLMASHLRLLHQLISDERNEAEACVGLINLEFLYTVVGLSLGRILEDTYY